ncbi:MAG: hypothetical protein RIT27_188 [Pseudomonadota bacterium]|jgi:zinc transport system permease protein
MNFFDALMQYSFLQYALVAGLLAGLGCGVIGTYVVVKRISSLAGGIAHAVLGGMGAAYYFHVSVTLGALVAALFSALLLGWIRLRKQQNEDTLVSALWSIGMAVGILFISQTAGYNADLMTYLFGNILMVRIEDLYWMMALDVLLMATIGIYYKQFLAITFDEEFARLRGVSVDLFYLILLCLVALTVVLLMQVVGLILVIALLTLPAAIAILFVNDIFQIMIVASLLGMLFSSGGLILAYQPDLPVGAMIILMAAIVYLIAVLTKTFWQRFNYRKSGPMLK